MDKKTVKTTTVEITLGEDHILFIRTLPGTNQTEDDAHKNLTACRRLLDEEQIPILVDIRGTGVLESDARNVYATGAEFALALALLVDSPFTRIAANLFMRVSNPRHPTKVFTAEDEARQWLKGFVR
jgi:hypothetical protein